MTGAEWKVPTSSQPKQQGYSFDLDRALSAVVGLSATVPADAFTAETLGTERAGNAVLIRDDGILLTIGYLVTEAESVWLTVNDGRVVPGHVLGVDGQTGFGLVQALGPLSVPPLPTGRSSSVEAGDPVVVAGAGGRKRSVAARIAMKQEFAGYWEYLLDEALFTTPSHPHWGGTAVIGPNGDLVGLGSLQLQGDRGPEKGEALNMAVPIDLLAPILDDMLRFGRPDRPARPWLGFFATEVEGRVAIAGVSSRGPAASANLRSSDVILAVSGRQVGSLAELFRAIWALGDAGTTIPLRIERDGRTMNVSVPSTDRASLFRRPVMH